MKRARHQFLAALSIGVATLASLHVSPALAAMGRIMRGIARKGFASIRALAAVIALVGLTLAGVAPCAHAAGVSFTNVADTTTTAPGHGAFDFFDVTPSLSGSNVAFAGYYSGGAGGGIYTGSVGVTGAAKIVDTTTTAPGHGAFTGLAYPSVSGSNVAFDGEYSGGEGIYTGSVGVTGAAKIVDTTTTAPGHGAFTDFGTYPYPSVSGSNVAFRGIYSGGEGIYTGSVGVTGAAKVADTTTTAPGHGAFTSFGGPLGIGPSVSGSNVAFVGGYSGGSGIYTGSVGAAGAAKIADTTNTAPGHGPFADFGGATSVSGSIVGFVGIYDGGAGAGIYTGSVGVTGAAKVVDTGDTAPGHGPFTGLGFPSVSGSNVAFVGGYSGGGGIYLASGGAGGSLSAVLNDGDPLFGSTVTSLGLGRSAYDNNAIAFYYALANGRSGIGVAIVPEPASLSLLALGGLTLLRRRRSEV